MGRREGGSRIHRAPGSGTGRSAGAGGAPAVGRAAGTGGISAARQTARLDGTDRGQASPRRRVLAIAVAAVGPGRRAGRREFLLGHGGALRDRGSST